MSALERLAQARAARERAEASRPTVEEQQAEIERTQRRAEEYGQVGKTAGQSGVAGVLKRSRGPLRRFLSIWPRLPGDAVERRSTAVVLAYT